MEVFVDELGSNAYTYAQAQSIGTPWLTLTKVNSSAVTGDIATILAGIHTNSGMDVGYTLSKAFTFRGQNAPSLVGGKETWSTILDAANNSWGVGPQSVSMDLILKNIEWRNIKATGAGSSYYIMGLNGGAGAAVVNWIVDHCKFKTFGAMHGGVAAGGIISSSLAGTHGNIDFSFCILDNIYDSQIDANGSQIFGFRISQAGKTVKIYNNTIYLPRIVAAEMVDGIWAATNQPLATLTWKNNIVYSAASIPFYKAGSQVFPNKTIDYNCHYNITGVPAGVGNISTDPLLVDPTNGAFGLRNNGIDIISPCIDTGITTI